jgi:thiol-disulfide isomerase/thioredoxin
MIRRRGLIVAAAVAAAMGAGLSWWRHTSPGTSSGMSRDSSGDRARGGTALPAAGDRSIGAPADEAVAQLFALELKGPGGEPMPMEQFRSKRLVINFWATWCAPCIEEMPELSEMAGEFSDKNIVFVGIAIDQAPNVARFIEKLPVRYPIVVAGSAGIGLVTALGNAQGGLPFTVVLGADGRIRERYLGKVPMRALRQVLTS